MLNILINKVMPLHEALQDVFTNPSDPEWRAQCVQSRVELAGIKTQQIITPPQSVKLWENEEFLQELKDRPQVSPPGEFIVRHCTVVKDSGFVLVAEAMKLNGISDTDERFVEALLSAGFTGKIFALPSKLQVEVGKSVTWANNKVEQ